jgi:hypothetical protein
MNPRVLLFVVHGACLYGRIERLYRYDDICIFIARAGSRRLPELRPGKFTPTTIAVYNAGNTLIESANLTFNTGGGTDTGEFLGFLEASPDISYFTLTDNYVSISGLTTLGLAESASIPEPGSIALLGLGLAGLFGIRRKSKHT